MKKKFEKSNKKKKAHSLNKFANMDVEHKRKKKKLTTTLGAAAATVWTPPGLGAFVWDEATGTYIAPAHFSIPDDATEGEPDAKKDKMGRSAASSTSGKHGGKASGHASHSKGGKGGSNRSGNVHDDDDDADGAEQGPDGPTALVTFVSRLIALRRAVLLSLDAQGDAAKDTAALSEARECEYLALEQLACARDALGGSELPEALSEAVAAAPDLFTVVSLATGGVAALTPGRVVQAVCGIDDVFFAVHYAAAIARYLSPTRCAALAGLPSPAAYLRDSNPFFGTDNYQAQWDAFRAKELGKALSSSLKHEIWRGDDSPNPLLECFRLRVRETVLVMYTTGLFMGGSPPPQAKDDKAQAPSRDAQLREFYEKQLHLEQARKRKKGGNGPTGVGNGRTEPLCPDKTLRLWRDNCREMLTHLYAYAVPNAAALELLGRFSPVIEMGAGTGYWAHMMRERGVDIVAYDVAPPSPDHKAKNEYHGQLPCWTSVGMGGPELLSHHPGRTLFLCYPPPHHTIHPAKGASSDAPAAATMDMSLRCLQVYTGKYVVHVGEWDGTTGSTAFQDALMGSFVVVERVGLPNWGNTAYDLTVWRRISPNTVNSSSGANNTHGHANHGSGSNSVPIAPSNPSNGFNSGFNSNNSGFNSNNSHNNSNNNSLNNNNKALAQHKVAVPRSCTKCGQTSGWSNGAKVPLRRCRWCRDASYCSPECHARDEKDHRRRHALKMIFVPETDFSSNLEYIALN